MTDGDEITAVVERLRYAVADGKRRIAADVAIRRASEAETMREIAGCVSTS